MCAWRARLRAAGVERRLLERLVALLRVHKLVKARGRARTDSTEVVAAMRTMHRLARVSETFRAALNTVATVVPAWVHAMVPVAGLDRSARRAEATRFPQQEAERTA